MTSCCKSQPSCVFFLSKGSISLYSALQLDCASAEQTGLGEKALWKSCSFCHNLAYYNVLFLPERS